MCDSGSSSSLRLSMPCSRLSSSRHLISFTTSNCVFFLNRFWMVFHTWGRIFRGVPKCPLIHTREGNNTLDQTELPWKALDDSVYPFASYFFYCSLETFWQQSVLNYTFGSSACLTTVTYTACSRARTKAYSVTPCNEFCLGSRRTGVCLLALPRKRHGTDKLRTVRMEK